MADKEPTIPDPTLLKSSLPALVIPTAIALAYARALDRGLALELEELNREVDRSQLEVGRCTNEKERPARRATAHGYDHALAVRMKGRKALPKTFSV